MKTIRKGIFSEMLGGVNWLKNLTHYIWNLPIYKVNEKGIVDIPKTFIKNGLITNNQLDKLEIEKLIENYNRYCKEYNDMFNDEQLKETISKIIKLEKNIFQIRCVLEIEPKFTILKQKDKNGDMINYIVSRTTFFSDDYKRDEINYYVGKLEDWGNDLNEIIKNPKFMEMSIQGLTKLMLEKMKD